jgi:DNA-3-methyladenine glycosylase II
MKNLPPEILADVKLAELAKRYGPPDIESYHGSLGTFESLVRSIIYQQLSGKAAAAIHARFQKLFLRGKMTPQKMLALAPKEMRSVGLSGSKVVYLKDLAQKFVDGTVPYRSFRTMTNDEIIEHLVKVKGVGEWTAHMFLIFTLHRPDILPIGDLAIRKGFQRVYGLRKIPDKKKMEKLAKPWRQHASIGSWYLWRSVDGE